MLTVLGFLSATMLAFRFNVFILLPTILLAWMLVLVSGIVIGSSGASIAMHMVLTAVILQIGYLAGILVKWALLASHRHTWVENTTISPEATF
jgi:hypothetical protein